MYSFETLTQMFTEKFEQIKFPATLPTLYDPANYFLGLGGKRIRPVTCLMGNELFDTISPDAWHAGVAIELFHNFSLIHDDIMDKAPLRRGKATVHTLYGESTALLAGDVMLVTAYDHLNKIKATEQLNKILTLFNKTAREVCEGQQLDMDFELRSTVGFDEYVRMIELKTSVLLAASLKMGAILGGANEGNQQHLYEFGRNLGIAFQVQDDYLDAFGDPAKFGKQVGGDIVANKKTFLLIKAMELANERQLQTIHTLLATNGGDKVSAMLEIYSACGVDQWAKQFMRECVAKAYQHMEDIGVLSSRKTALLHVGDFLISRDF